MATKPAKRRTSSPASRSVSSAAMPLPAVPKIGATGALPPAVVMGGAAGDYDNQTGLTLPRIGHAADPGRNPDFPQFGQLGRTGLMSVGGIVGNRDGAGATRVYNPERISLGELDEMSLDPVIRSCLLGYLLILQTAELSVSCADASMKALVESQFLPLMPQLLREVVRPAMVFGWADTEIVWQTLYNVAVEVDAGEMNAKGTAGPDGDPGDKPIRVFPYVTTIKDFVPLNNTTLTLRQTLAGDFAGVVQWGWGEVFLPPSRLLHMPLGAMFRNPYGESAIKGCYPFWIWTRFLYEMLMVAVERGAAPPLLGRYPAGQKINVGSAQDGTTAFVDAGDYLLGQLSQLRSFSTAVIPRLLNKDGKDMYDVAELPLEAHIDWIMQGIAALNAQKQLYMFFPDKLLQSGDIGSYALAKEHTDLFSLAIQAKLNEILGNINTGPLARFVRYNDPNCPPAKLTYAAPNIQAMMALSTAVVQAITTGTALVTQNQDKVLVPDWQKLADQFGIPYSVVRRMDGMDALGNPLQPGADPNAQDHAAAQAAGMVPPDGSGGGVPYQTSGSGAGGSAPDAGQGQSADDYLESLLGPAGSQSPYPEIAGGESKAQMSELWVWDDTDAKALTMALTDAQTARMNTDIEDMKRVAAHHKHLRLTLRGLDLGDADRVALAKSMFTAHQADMLTHLHTHGVSTYEDIKGAMPHVLWPHKVVQAPNMAGLTEKVKHPVTGKTAFQITQPGKEALATHLGWGGAQAAPAAPATPPIKNGEANALHSLMTNGPQNTSDLLGANSLHTLNGTGVQDLGNLHTAGHLAPTGQEAGGLPTYAITSQGASALAAHMGSGTPVPAADASANQPAPADTPSPEPTAPGALSAGHAAMLQHLAGNGPSGLTPLVHTYHEAEAGVAGFHEGLNQLTQAGHAALKGGQYSITPKGSNALADHKASSGETKPTSPLSDKNAALLQTVKDNPNEADTYGHLMQAHTVATGSAIGTADAVSGLVDSGHLKQGGSIKNYSLTDKGENDLAAHAAAPVVAPAIPASEGSTGHNAGEHKAEGGSAEKPDEAYHFEPGTAPAAAAGTKGAGAKAADASALSAPHAALLKHLQDTGPQSLHDIQTAGHPFGSAVTPAFNGYHIKSQVAEDGKVHYGLSEQGKAALDAHNADGTAAKPSSLPDGWKPISTQSDKGYKSTHEGKTAFVKKQGEQYSVVTTDGRDADIHPEAHDTKEAAMAHADDLLGKPKPEPPAAPEPKPEPLPAKPPKTAKPKPAAVDAASLTKQEKAYLVHIHAWDTHGESKEHDNASTAMSKAHGHDWQAVDATKQSLKEKGLLTSFDHNGAKLSKKGKTLAASLPPARVPKDDDGDAADATTQNAVTLPNGWSANQLGSSTDYHSDSALGHFMVFQTVNGQWVCSPGSLSHTDPDVQAKAKKLDEATFGTAQEAIDATQAHITDAEKPATLPPPKSTAKTTTPLKTSQNVSEKEKSYLAMKHAIDTYGDQSQEMYRAYDKMKDLHNFSTSEMDATKQSVMDKQLMQMGSGGGYELTDKGIKALQESDTDGSGDDTAAAAPAPVDKPYVTFAGKKQELSDAPVTDAQVQAVVSGTLPKLSEKAKTVLQSAVTSGKIKTESDFHQALAIAEAANKGVSYSSLTGYSMDAGINAGGIKALKEKAAGGDATATQYAAALGDTNIQSDKEVADAAHAKAQEAFKTASISDLTHIKTGGAAGSNDGGFYTTAHGQKVYVKHYASADQAHSEHLTNALYHALGAASPVSTVKTEGGKTVYASQILDNDGTLGKVGLTKARATDALSHAAADILTANWDAAGTGLDNMVVGKDGKIARIDNGGALLYRAQGAKKDPKYLGGIREWEAYSDPASNPHYAKLFQKAGIASVDEIPGITKQIAAIEDIAAKPGGWKKFVSDHAPGMSAGEKASVVDMLTKRTALLSEKRKEIIAKNSGMLPRDYKMISYADAKTDALATHATTITGVEKTAMSSFKGSGYHSINAALRTTGLANASDALKATIAHLDKLYARKESHLSHDLIVSRKLDVEITDPGTKHYLDAEPGTVITDPGFGSTSVTPSAWHGNYHLQLHLPKEANVVLPGAYTSTNEGEQEITLNRNHQYRIVSIDPPGSGKLEGDPAGWSWQSGAHRVKAELIVPGVNDDETLAKKAGVKAKAHKNLTVSGMMDGADSNNAHAGDGAAGE